VSKWHHLLREEVHDASRARGEAPRRTCRCGEASTGGEVGATIDGFKQQVLQDLRQQIQAVWRFLHLTEQDLPRGGGLRMLRRSSNFAGTTSMPGAPLDITHHFAPEWIAPRTGAVVVMDAAGAIIAGPFTVDAGDILSYGLPRSRQPLASGVPIALSSPSLKINGITVFTDRPVRAAAIFFSECAVSR
jgi:hypothetical protein